MDKCTNEAPEGIETMLCVDHLRKAWAAYQIIAGTDADEFRQPPKRASSNPHMRDANGSVYFAQVGKYVKIGWSSNVPQRMLALHASALYVTYPGTRADEAKAHRLFRKYLATGAEYFYPQPVLMEYIKGLQTGSVPTPEPVS